MRYERWGGFVSQGSCGPRVRTLPHASIAKTLVWRCCLHCAPALYALLCLMHSALEV